MKQFSIALIILATLGTVLLTGQALGLKSFGGPGFMSYLTLHIDGVKYPRGSTYEFQESKYIAPLLYYSTDTGLSVFGEKGTRIEFTDTRLETFDMHLITGRMTVKGATTVHMNKVSFRLTNRESKAEFIHYSWRDEVEIILDTGTLEIEGQDPLIAPAHVMLSTETGLIVR